MDTLKKICRLEKVLCGLGETQHREDTLAEARTIAHDGALTEGEREQYLSETYWYLRSELEFYDEIRVIDTAYEGFRVWREVEFDD